MHVLTAKTQSGYEDGITYYDARTVPGRFEIGEPGSGGGDGEPDLRVVMEWLEVLPAGNGARFGLSGAVENEGDGPSPATTLRYYRSTNETISRNDTEVATHPVPALAAGEDTGIPANLSITLDMPTTPGTHYYGACVDSVPGESDTGNNCDGAGTLTVEEPDPPTGDDHGNTTGDATVVSGISTTQGELEQGGDVDYFRIDLDHPGRLTVETTGPTDTYGTLSGPNGLIGQNDDAGEGANFLINANVEAGAHYVAVRGFNSSTTGSYTLVVDYEPEAVDPIGPTVTHTVPLVTSASRTDQQGFVRVINRSDRAGTVSIRAIDDAGNRSQPVTLSMGASATRHFNSGDLEDGNSAKGLSDGVGGGRGDWRLELESDLDILALAYIRTPDGFLASVHDIAPESDGAYHAAIFNPGSNDQQRSLLRLINPNDRTVDVTIDGVDDGGAAPPSGRVRLSLRANEATTVTAQDLENGRGGLQGRFGDGTGKWQLFVTSTRPIHVMSLMDTPTGNLINLSTFGIGDQSAAATGSAGNARYATKASEDEAVHPANRRSGIAGHEGRSGQASIAAAGRRNTETGSTL